MYNNNLERKKNRVKRNTPSLWEFLNSSSVHKDFINPNYKNSNILLYSRCSRIRPRLWSRYYFRHNGASIVGDPNNRVRILMDQHAAKKTMISRAAGKITRLFGASPPPDAAVIRNASENNINLATGHESSVLLGSTVIDDYSKDK